MSKDQKKTITFTVETVDNLIEKLEWINSTIRFWHLKETWPTNLIADVCNTLSLDLQNKKNPEKKSRSVFNLY